MKTLEDYISDISEAVDEPVEVVAEKKKIGRPKGAKNMKYNFCSTFNSLSEAKEIVTMEKIWLFNLRSILQKIITQIVFLHWYSKVKLLRQYPVVVGVHEEVRINQKVTVRYAFNRFCSCRLID